MKSKKDRAKFTVLCMIAAVMMISVSLNLAQSNKLSRQENQMRRLVADYVELNDQCRRLDSIVSSMDTLVHTLMNKVAEQYALPAENE